MLPLVFIPLAVLLFVLEPVLASRGEGGALGDGGVGGRLQAAKAALTDRVSALGRYLRLCWHVGLGVMVVVVALLVVLVNQKSEFLCKRRRARFLLCARGSHLLLRHSVVSF